MPLQPNEVGSSDAGSDYDIQAAFEQWSTEELRQWLRNRTLYAGGNRDELEERVLDHDPFVPDITEMSNAELKDWLRERQLSTKGNSEALQNRVLEQALREKEVTEIFTCFGSLKSRIGHDGLQTTGIQFRQLTTPSELCVAGSW